MSGARAHPYRSLVSPLQVQRRVRSHAQHRLRIILQVTTSGPTGLHTDQQQQAKSCPSATSLDSVPCLSVTCLRGRAAGCPGVLLWELGGMRMRSIMVPEVLLWALVLAKSKKVWPLVQFPLLFLSCQLPVALHGPPAGGAGPRAVRPAREQGCRMPPGCLLPAGHLKRAGH